MRREKGEGKWEMGRKGVRILRGVLLLCFLMFLGFAARPRGIGAPAPDFSLQTMEGKRVTLGDFQGKVLLLNFWATWCKPCEKELPLLQAAFSQHQKGGLMIVGINAQENGEKVTPYITEKGLSYPILLDTDGKVLRRYGIIGLPASFIIDSQGILRDAVFGELTSREQLEEKILPLLSKAAASNKRDP